MRKLTSVLGILILCWSLSAFACNDCNPPNCTITTECDQTGFCWKVKKRRFFTNQNLQNRAGDTGDFVAVLDLSNQWIPDSTKDFEVKIRYEDATLKAPLEETFPLKLDTVYASNLSPLSYTTTPYAFVLDDPSDAADFLDDGHNLGYLNASVTMEISITLTQANCEETISTGDYTNYERWGDSSGLDGAGSFTIHYVYPEYGTEACNQGTITVSNDEEE